MLKFFLLSFSLILGAVALASDAIDLVRKDGSKLRAYLALPQASQFPVIVLLGGSGCTSAHRMWITTGRELARGGSAVLVLEKYGLKQDTTACPKEFLEHNTLSQRIEDALLGVGHMRGKVAGWNGHFIWVGESEGGLVAAFAAPQVSETQALIMLGSGGGMALAEAIRLRTKKASGDLKEIEKRFLEIKSRPISELEWLSHQDGRFTYKYWNSILWESPLSGLERVTFPIYVAHGEKDSVIPVESAIALQERFQKLKKKNLWLKVYPGLEHNWLEASGKSQASDVFNDVQAWCKINCSNKILR